MVDILRYEDQMPMDKENAYANAFALPDFRESMQLDFTNIDFPVLPYSDSYSCQLQVEPKWSDNVGELGLTLEPLDELFPELDDSITSPFDDCASLQSSGASIYDALIEPLVPVEDDIWSVPDFLAFKNLPEKAKNWENFHDRNFKSPPNPYISENGPGVFDALLVLHARTQNAISEQSPVHRLKPGSVIECLAQLGLGKESILYSFNAIDRTFHTRLGAENICPSGFSSWAFTSLEQDFLALGNRFRFLSSFAHEPHQSLKSLVSLASCISTVLYTIEATLYEPVNQIRSILQLQSLFHNPGLIIQCLEEILSRAVVAQSDERILSLLYQLADESENSNSIRPVLFEILARVSKCWFHGIGDWLGFNSGNDLPDYHTLPNFIHVQRTSQEKERENTRSIEYIFVETEVPSFLGGTDALRIFQVGQGLRLLHASSTDHPLIRPDAKLPIQSCLLDLRFDWLDLEDIQKRVNHYETALLSAIRGFDKHRSNSTENDSNTATTPAGLDPSHDVVDFGNELLLSSWNMKMEQPLINPLMNTVDDSLVMYTESCCRGEVQADDAQLFRPPLSLVPLLSINPILSAQARLVNQSCMFSLFKEHNLRSHLNLHYRYSLLSDGVFTSRVSYALFDAELPSAERRQGKSRIGVSGLRLGCRETWPPASSELRLALMGILNESYYRDDHFDARISRRADLPGNMSFAIRAMSEDELQKCMDPNSIFALDFLRLQYKPPSSLDAIITQASLDRYDAIFKLLLRITRLVYSVKQLRQVASSHSKSGGHDAAMQRFSIEATHVITTICGHFFEEVKRHWTAFWQSLDELETHIEQYSISEHESLNTLRDMHEEMLGEIMFGLLLRQRQEVIMKHLEEIFETVLNYAALVGTLDSLDDGGSHVAEQGLSIYQKWKKKVKVFVGVCRGLSERKAMAGSRRSGEVVGENSIERLLLKLEMSSYYSQRTT